MPRDPVVMSGNVGNERISRVPFRKETNIGGRETRTEMFAHRDTLVSLVMLGGFINSVTDAFFPHQTEIG